MDVGWDLEYARHSRPSPDHTLSAGLRGHFTGGLGGGVLEYWTMLLLESGSVQSASLGSLVLLAALGTIACPKMATPTTA